MAACCHTGSGFGPRGNVPASKLKRNMADKKDGRNDAGWRNALSRSMKSNLD
jgi:hypothetical protein